MIGRPSLAAFPPGARMPERVLDDHELVWVRRGRVRLTGDDPRDLRPGDLLMIPPGLQHGIDWDPRGESRHGYVHFDAESVAVAMPHSVQVVRMTRDDPLMGLCDYLVWLGTREDAAARVTDTLETLLRVTLEGPLPGGEEAPDVPRPVAAALAWLSETWDEPPLRRVSVADLAAAAHVSVGHLNRLVAATFGRGPAAAIDALRRAHAETLLQRTDLPLAVVARECGYADASHFSHAFRSAYGQSPRAYRDAGGPGSVLDDPAVRRLQRLVRQPE